MTATAQARAGLETPPPASRSAPGASRRVALLGAGYIAEWHAKSLASVRGVELVAVCDTAPGRARGMADRFGAAAAYESLDDMLAGERLDAVHVLLPPDLHAQAANAVLSSGAHVFLEKPMCTRAADCDVLVASAEERGLRLGVGHNFLFSAPYERLRRDVAEGWLGPLDHVAITWHRELPQAAHGPFDAWMLREPGNVMLEIGSHSVAHMLDLVGVPDDVRATASNAVSLPTGQPFARRWHVDASCRSTAVELRFSFIPGFAEHTIHVRGRLGSATVDFLRNTYTLQRHRGLGDDFDRHAMARGVGRQLRRQADSTLAAYVLSKLHVTKRGTPYGASIARAMDAFYVMDAGTQLDSRIAARTGAQVIRTCERIVSATALEPAPRRKVARAAAVVPEPRVLVLGATGFIGQELVRQLASGGRSVRVLVRNASKLPPDLPTTAVQPVRGDAARPADLREAMRGIDCVYHLARSNVRTWAEYQEQEIGVTRAVAEAALEAGVKRLVYAGTIDSYYAGARAGVITEAVPLDRAIARRNLYARAKAASEELLFRMHRERGLPVVVMRPGIVVGRGGSPFHWGVGMWWNDSVCRVWGDGRNVLPLVLVDDVAAAMVSALDAPGIEGESFNLVGDARLTAREYLAELERCSGMRIDHRPLPISWFYAADLLKYAVKVLVRHPERRLPSYRDWESRTQRARFDCALAKERLGWRPVGDRDEFIRRGIALPVADALR